MAHDNRTSVKYLRVCSMADIVEKFRAALVTAGIEFAKGERIIPDGTLHRIRLTQDKPGQQSGWYCLHLDLPASGAGGSWKSGARVNWCAKRSRTLSAAELSVLHQRFEAARLRAQAEQEALYREAAKRGAWVWKHAKPADPNHEYLRRKGLELSIARQHGDALVLPVLDFSGYLRGVQYIRPDGQKRFLSGMKKAGAFIPVAGKPDGKRPLWMAERWGTACTLQALRPLVCVIAGLDAGNLASVATEARRRWPALDIVVCPDFDSVGRQKGQEAAEKACAKILPPPAEIPPGYTDWNDVMAARRHGAAHA